jgi:hypothetical protein
MDASKERERKRERQTGRQTDRQRGKFHGREIDARFRCVIGVRLMN